MGKPWQIKVLCDFNGSSTMVVTVPENCTTEELFNALRKHSNIPSADDFDLLPANGDYRKKLAISSTERLSDYNVTDNSAVTLVVSGPGRGWPTSEKIYSVSRTLEPADGIKISTISDENKDVIGIEVDGPAVIMHCGHAAAPGSLALYCHSELENGKSEIRCPECKEKWKFAHLKKGACLTPHEITQFEGKALVNGFKCLQDDMKPCPNCEIFVTPYRKTDKRLVCSNCSNRNTGKKFEFCWICLREWTSSGTNECGNPNCESRPQMFKALETCDEIEIACCGVKTPKIRACPKCTVLIHHDGGSKRMTCQICKYEFCFICLKTCASGSTDAYKACALAPRQTQDTVGKVPGLCAPS